MKSAFPGKGPDHLLEKRVDGGNRKPGEIMKNGRKQAGCFASDFFSTQACVLYEIIKIFGLFAICQTVKLIKNPVLHFGCCLIGKGHRKYLPVIVPRPEDMGEIDAGELKCLSRSR
jgi:hypothetical protein